MLRHSYVVSAYIATLPYDTLLSYPILPCEIFLRVPVKITVHVLAAGCQFSYRKLYRFLQCIYRFFVEGGGGKGRTTFACLY